VGVKLWVVSKQEPIVVKIGGSIIRAPQDLQRISRVLIDELLEREYRLVITISAIKGITDKLITLCSGNKKALEDIREIHDKFSSELGLSGIYRDHVLGLNRELEEYSSKCIDSPEAMDRVLSIGERYLTILLAEILEHMGVRVRIAWPWDIGLITDNRYGDASPKIPVALINIGESLRKILDEGYVPIVPGFIGSTEDGRITTMGRGSSDLTAVLIARTLRSPRTLLLTETPGIMTADPKIVPTARTVDAMDLVEGERASRYRVKGLNQKTFLYLGEYDGEIYISDLSFRGTRICRGCRRPGIKVIAPFSHGVSAIGWGSGEILLKTSITGVQHKIQLGDVEAVIYSDEDKEELVRRLHKEVFGI
jgi:aspartate kinase